MSTFKIVDVFSDFEQFVLITRIIDANDMPILNQNGEYEIIVFKGKAIDSIKPLKPTSFKKDDYLNAYKSRLNKIQILVLEKGFTQDGIGLVEEKDGTYFFKEYLKNYLYKPSVTDLSDHRLDEQMLM